VLAMWSLAKEQGRLRTRQTLAQTARGRTVRRGSAEAADSGMAQDIAAGYFSFQELKRRNRGGRFIFALNGQGGYP